MERKIVKCCLLTMSLVLISLFSFGQKKNLRHYYYWINQAELAICDSNYHRASDCYDKAFGCHRPFSMHDYHAFILNAKYYPNEKRALQSFHRLIQTGEKIEWYKEDSVLFAPIWSQMKSMADTTKRVFSTELRDAFKGISDSDQKVRREMFDNDDIEDKVIRYTDSVNLEKYKTLFQTNPEISDYTVGTAPVLHTFLIHACRQFLFDPKDILYDEVINGNIEASRYVLIEDICRGDFINPYLGEKCKTVYGTNVSCFFVIDSIGFIIQPENLKEVNINRKKINMSETWEDHAKKIAYRYLRESEFVFYNTNRLIYMPEDAKRKVAETMELIDKGIIKGKYYIIPEEIR